MHAEPESPHEQVSVALCWMHSAQRTTNMHGHCPSFTCTSQVCGHLPDKDSLLQACIRLHDARPQLAHHALDWH